RIAAMTDPNSALDLDLSLTARRWDRLASLLQPPVSGIQGGSMALNLRGRGTLQALADGDWSGDLKIAGATLLSSPDPPGQPALAVAAASTAFAHRGGRWQLPDARLATNLRSVAASPTLLD